MDSEEQKEKESKKSLKDVSIQTSRQIDTLWNSLKKKESLYEKIMAQNFPNLRKEMDIQILKAQTILTRINP